MTHATVFNVSALPLRSPFRYPGGKTWLIPYVRQWLLSLVPRVETLIEPFAGGASVSLTAVFEELVDSVEMVELDPYVSAVWRTILGGHSRWLTERITNFQISRRAVTEVLNNGATSLRERAFVTVVRNRVQRGGILGPTAGLLRKGERGRGLKSRWYPKALGSRILAISARRSSIHFLEGDGLAHISEKIGALPNAKKVAMFVDPPYTTAAKRLYRYSEIDHSRLFDVLQQLGCRILMTYNNSRYIRQLAKAHGFETRLVRMKNTHNRRMSELLISDSFSWWNPGVLDQFASRLVLDKIGGRAPRIPEPR